MMASEREAVMVTIRHERTYDVALREKLLDQAFGEGRTAKTAERLRSGRLPADKLSFVATENGRLVGTVRLWNVSAGPQRPALLLGPVAVAHSHRNQGIGAALMRHALAYARLHRHRAVLLVGDAPYYGRFGFSGEKADGLMLPGPFERHRFLGCELVPGALEGAHGVVAATGRSAAKPARSARVARFGQHDKVAPQVA
jgi:predicted N-acetyltransferase YhbS